jgi:tetratricopeptide (TPR) repeat protein
MKKILTFLTSLIFLGFVAAGLYVFGLPPFQAGGPLAPAAPAGTQQQSALPDFLSQDKVTRNQSFDDHMNRGQLLEDNQYYSLAISEYQQANSLDPNNEVPFLKIGRIQLLTGDYAKAEENLTKAVSINPNDVDAQIYLGRTFLAERKIDQAKPVFAGLDGTNNQTISYYQGIIDAYYGDYDDSKKLLALAISLGTSPDITSKAQNYLGAFSEYDFNQGGQPVHLETLLARSYAQTGEYQMAIPLLFEVIKEKKDYRDAWIILGYSYLNIGDYQDADESLQQAKLLDTQNPETFFYLGLAYYGENNLPLAAASLQQAKNLGFQPVIQVDQKLAEIDLETKQYEKSAQLYEEVVGINDDDINYYIRPIWIYLEKTNEPAKAVALAQKAFTDHPNQPMSYNLIGWAEIGTSQFDEAQKNLQQAISLDPKLDAAYLNLGWLQEKRGDFNGALNDYVKANQLGNGDSISNAAAQRYNSLISKMKNSNSNTGLASVTAP